MIERPAPLSPIYMNSFAFVTFKDRLPVIITKVVDSLYRNKKSIADLFGTDKLECIKYITAEMSRLRHELGTNKPITLFDEHIFGDEHLWNDSIVEEKNRLYKAGIIEKDFTWFKCSFLFGECYMYRRIYDAVLKSGFSELDQFSFEKSLLLQNAITIQRCLSVFLYKIWPELSTSNKSYLFSNFETIIKMSLWANEVDLSLSIDDDKAKIKLENPEIIIKENDNKLLIDDVENVFDLLYKKSKIKQEEVIVTIFLDNSGSELLADLHLVEFLLASKLAHKVVLYVKSMPWYVSDVTEKDFQLTVQYLCDSTDLMTQWLGNRIYSRLTEDCNLLVRPHNFLSLPHPFCKMNDIYPDLYQELSQSTILIFKGDLNYRKLVSDLQWSVTGTSFLDGLLGFNPTSLVSLRILKCEVQVGLTKEVLSRLEKDHPDDWMISSRYGVIQSCISDRR